jgi:hypothetical protein
VGIETLNIDELPAAAALSGPDLIELQQGAQGVRSNLADIINFIVTTDAFNNAVTLRIPAFLEDYFDFGTDDLTILTNVNIAGDLYVNGDQIYQWQQITDPPQGVFAQKVAGWTADRFSAATGGMEIDFTSACPAGTIRVICNMLTGTATAYIYARSKGDPNISNTPVADNELSCCVGRFPIGAGWPVEIPITTDGKAEIAVSDINIDIYLSYPRYVLSPIGAI